METSKSIRKGMAHTSCLEILMSDGLALSWYGYELASQKYHHEHPDASEKPSLEEQKPYVV
jgi:hypothetical protein